MYPWKRTDRDVIDPNAVNTSLMPFASVDNSGQLVFFPGHSINTVFPGGRGEECVHKCCSCVQVHVVLLQVHVVPLQVHTVTYVVVYTVLYTCTSVCDTVTSTCTHTVQMYIGAGALGMYGLCK